MRLVAVGINRCTGITQHLYQSDIIVYIPLDGVVVIVNQNGIRPAFVSHLEGLDEPVVASLTATAKRFLHHGVTLLVHTDSLVHHVNHRQGVEVFLRLVKPFGKCCQTVLGR